MILVDTSVWIDHLRESDPDLVRLLNAGQVTTHDLVIEELAMGSIRQRQEVLDSMGGLARLPAVEHARLMAFVDARGLFGRGIGVVDAHLLASAIIVPGTALWTRDVRLARIADECGIAAASPR